MDITDDNEKVIIENFSYVFACLYRFNSVVEELATLYKPRKGKEFRFVSQQTFKFYHLTLMYTFVCDYCKLLEFGSRVEDRHWGSLNKLNEEIKRANPNYLNYDLVKSKILALINSPFHSEKVRTLRDKTFAHLDKNGEPHKVTPFNDEEFETAKKQLEEMIIILNLCGEANDIEYLVKTNDEFTERFINKYAQFYETREEIVSRMLGKKKST